MGGLNKETEWLTKNNIPFPTPPHTKAQKDICEG